MPTENMICLIVWCTVFVIALLTEIFTEQLVSIWFSIGAIPAIICSAFPSCPYWVTIIVFFAVSGISLWISLKFFSKKLRLRSTPLNLDLLIGRQFHLLTNITEENMGEVEINGVRWRCTAQKPIEKDTIITVIEVCGNHLLVVPLEEKREEK